jgi:hypothetical protein
VEVVVNGLIYLIGLIVVIMFYPFVPRASLTEESGMAEQIAQSDLQEREKYR